MNLKVSRSDLESVSRGFPAAFGAESEFRDFVGSCCYKLCGGEGARIPIRVQMQFGELMIIVNPETFENQIQPWPKCDFYWVH